MNYFQVYSDIIYLEENYTWPDNKEPEWVQEVRKMFPNTKISASFIKSWGYEYVAKMAMEELKHL